MDSEYFILWYRLDGVDKYLIWYTNDKDGVVLREGNMPVFSGKDSLLGHASAYGIHINQKEPKLHDLDVVARWVEAPSAETIDCDSFNAAWNLFADVSATANGEFDKDQRRTKKIYDKLYWGMNLPSITPEGKEYEPIWKKAEVEILQEIMTQGLELFRRTACEV